MPLTKAKIGKELYAELGFSEKECQDLVTLSIELIRQDLETGEDALLSGFGQFYVKETHQKKGGNPVTGEDLILDAKRVVTFICSGILRDRANGNG